MKFTVLLLSFIFLQQTKGDGLHSFQLSSTELNLIAGEKAEIIFTSFLNSSNPTTVNLIKNRHGIIKLKPKTFIIPPEINFFNQTIQITSLKSGKVEIEGHTDSNPDAIIFFRIIVAKSNFLIIIASVVGWIYFIAWSLSLYPQIWMIIQMKSVTGLSFDYLSLSFFGHLLYAVFNLALYFGKYFQDEYFRRHPHGLNPVELNDVFYCIHVLALSLITVICCFIFQRDNQKITKYAWSINGTFIFSLIIVAILCSFGKLHWFDLINTCNLIKVIGSLIKYVPQVYFNHKRKSTVGWSIDCIILDLIGGIFSMLQMIFNAHNYNDWESLYGDFTKLCIGFLSVFFDILFMLQHYVFYAEKQEKKMAI